MVSVTVEAWNGRSGPTRAARGADSRWRAGDVQPGMEGGGRLQAALDRSRGREDPPGRARHPWRTSVLLRCDSLLHRDGDGGRRHPDRPGPPALPARPGRGHAGQHGQPGLHPARPGSEARLRAPRQEGALRHRRRGGPHGRRHDRRLPGIDRRRPLRHRAPGRHTGQHPLLPALDRLPGSGRPAGHGPQHLPMPASRAPPSTSAPAWCCPST